MKSLAGLSVLVALALGLAANGSAKASSPSALSSSRLLSSGRIRCTVAVQSEVQAGQALDLRFSLHNVSKRPVKISLWVFSAGLVLKAPDGTVYNSSAPYEALPGIPPPGPPRKLRPGKTMHLGPLDVPVRWNGPVEVIPECLGKWLPPLRVGVVAPPPPPDETAAVDEVVAASGHLLDQCRPEAPGVAVDGQIDAPSGTAPPMDAQCSISVTSEGPFLIAQALVLVPPTLQGVQIFQPYETLWPIDRFVPLTAGPPYEAIAWEFVVTGANAIPVAAATMSASNDSGLSEPFFDWNGTGWDQNGEGSCGGRGFSSGGTGPWIEFISAC
jgi:hypothetical protein